MAEDSEVARRLSDSPGRVEIFRVLQTEQQVATQIEHVDKAEASTVDFIFATGRALGERDDNVSAYVLNSKRRIVDGQTRIGERAIVQPYPAELVIIGLNLSADEVRDVDARSSSRDADCQP